MPFLKRLFISIYLGFAALVVAYATWQGFHAHWTWLGLIASTLPIVYLSIGNVLLNHSATTHKWLPFPSFLAILGACWNLAWWIHDRTDTLLLVLQTFSIIGYILYLFWYSRFDRNLSSVIANGQPLPSFDAITSDGQRVSSRDLIGSPALLVFYRGNWCPVCVTQIREVAAHYRSLQERGIQVVMVSPQSDAHTQELAKNIDAPLTFWRDQDLSAAKTLGLVDKQGVPVGMDLLGYDPDTVLPTVIMTDETGIVFYNDQTDSYRIRPLPDEFLKAFEDHVAPKNPGTGIT
jgi:peroxiredoxin